MVTVLRPEQVRERYGKLFCRGFFTMVDEENGMAQIVEKCVSRGPVEWDTVNRKRAGGILKDIKLEGVTITMDTIIGEKETKFGPVSSELGGQGISSLKVEGDRVRTKWMGLAGATVGIGACIPQCDDVIETIYPDDFKIGGAHYAEVEIITPKMVRVIIGADDTDTKEKGASWVTMMRLGTECPIGRYLDHKIIQLNPKAPNKTTNCCSTAVAFAVRPDEIPELIEYARKFLSENTYSSETVMTVFKGLRIPEELEKFGWDAKHILFEVDDALNVAKNCNVDVIRITGSKGTIGAVAAIGCFDMGLRSAGVPEDFKCP
jgi:methanogenesis imperfect marker protein 11